jgi:hypothetical protein
MFKSFAKKQINRVADAFARRTAPRLTFQSLRDGREFYDLSEITALNASIQSALFIERHMLLAKAFATPHDLLEYSINLSRPGGLVLEFGVATGTTLSVLAKNAGDRTIVGFDTFEGLPEDWRTDREKGAYACPNPNIPSNALIVKGLFSDTLPRFVSAIDKPLSMVHIDCDLYSSTKCVLDNLADHITPGCVILFDEFLNYHGWRQHEYKAFREFYLGRNVKFDYVAFVPRGHQVCVVIR